MHAQFTVAIVGRPNEPEAGEIAGRLASESVQPIDDVRSTAAYRRLVVGRVGRGSAHLPVF